jgi:hypothetical protein
LSEEAYEWEAEGLEEVSGRNNSKLFELDMREGVISSDTLPVEEEKFGHN